MQDRPDVDIALNEDGDIVLDDVMPSPIPHNAEYANLVLAVASVREVGNVGHSGQGQVTIS